MGPRLSKEAAEGLTEFLADPLIHPQVKLLLQREYQPGMELFAIFVEHSWYVAEAALVIARSMGADLVFVKEAGWLHDIGIKYTHAPGIRCLGTEPYLRHGLIGRDLCEAVGLRAHGRVCLRHVGTGLTRREIVEQGLPLPPEEMLNETLEERIICYADQFFSKSRGGPSTVDDVRRRTKKFGFSSLGRFESMFQEFGSLFPVSRSKSPG